MSEPDPIRSDWRRLRTVPVAPAPDWRRLRTVPVAPALRSTFQRGSALFLQVYCFHRRSIVANTPRSIYVRGHSRHGSVGIIKKTRIIRPGVGRSESSSALGPPRARRKVLASHSHPMPPSYISTYYLITVGGGDDMSLAGNNARTGRHLQE
jgi:hypothetical protein